MEWSPLVTTGHRSLTSESSILRKSLESVFLVSPEGKHVNLFEDSEVKETHRLVLLCGIVGVFSGARYEIHQGYIQSASKNAADWYSSDDPNNRAKLIIYSDFDIVCTFAGTSSKIIKFSVQHLFDLVNLLAHISLSTVEFGDDNIDERIKDETEPSLTFAEKRASALKLIT